MYSEHVGWNRQRCGVTSEMVLWYHRIRATIISAMCAENARPLEELPQLPLNVSVLCTLNARPGDHHQVPSRRKHPNTYDMSNPPLDAVSFDRVPHFLPHDQTKATQAQAIMENPYRNQGSVAGPAPPEDCRELLARGQRPLSCHTRTRQA